MLSGQSVWLEDGEQASADELVGVGVVDLGGRAGGAGQVAEEGGLQAAGLLGDAVGDAREGDQLVAGEVLAGKAAEQLRLPLLPEDELGGRYLLAHLHEGLHGEIGDGGGV